MSSLRGGFRSVAHGATGVGSSRRSGAPGGSRSARNIITVLLVAAVAFFLLRRFGILHF